MPGRLREAFASWAKSLSSWRGGYPASSCATPTAAARQSDSPIEQTDPYFRDNLLFYEFFDGDTGRGLGAAHQTGWTGLVALLLEMCPKLSAAVPPVETMPPKAIAAN